METVIKCTTVTLVMLAKNIIAGDETSPEDADQKKRYNPSNGELVSSYFESGSQDVREAVDAAEKALNDGKWSSNQKIRAHALQKVSQAIMENLEEIAKIQSLETGKVFADSMIETRTASDLFDFYSGVTRSIYGKTSAPEPGKISITFREPVGIVTIIVPWNSPVVLLARSLAPALAAGNSVIVKPSSLTPLTVFKFIKLILDSSPEIPPGVLNLIQGSGSKSGRDLILDHKVNMISFTGSTETGKQIMRDASLDLKRFTLELGGKSPNVIFSDADLGNAVQGAIRGSMFGSAGQICFAGTRVLVHEDVHDAFIRKVREMIPGMKIGDAMESGVSVGPLVSADQHQKVVELIEYGRNSANLVIGGETLNGGIFDRGKYISPTVFDHVRPDSKIAQEEIFGPVLSVMPFSSIDEAVEIANKTRYGLSAAVWTGNVTTAFRAARGIKAGTVWVNTYGKMLSETESGGYKESGIGRSRGIGGLEAYTELKNIIFEA